MVASARDNAGSVGNIKALREIKKAEERVRDERAQAEETAEEIRREAREKARALIQEAKEEAELRAEGTIQEAKAEAEEEAKEILETAKAEAEGLRDVPEDSLDEAADQVLDRFRDAVGGA